MVASIIPVHPTDEQLRYLEEKLINRLEQEKRLVLASFKVFKRLREIEPDKYSQALIDWRWAIDSMP